MKISQLYTVGKGCESCQREIEGIFFPKDGIEKEGDENRGKSPKGRPVNMFGECAKGLGG